MIIEKKENYLKIYAYIKREKERDRDLKKNIIKLNQIMKYVVIYWNTLNL